MTTTTTTAPARTAAEKILAAFTDPNAALTAKAIMDATGLSRTTVNTNLGKLAEKGDTIRFDQDNVTTWSLTPTRKAAVKRAAKKAAGNKPATPRKSTAPGVTKALNKAVTPRATTAKKGNRKVTDENSTTATDENTGRTPTGRRLKGAIDNEIRAFFQANNNEPNGSYKVAKGIGSSAGAAYVALRRMAAEGKARLVSTEPDRYDIDFESAAWNTDN